MPKPIFRKRGSLPVTCSRCGNIEYVRREGAYRDEDFLEVFHERQALEQSFRNAMRLVRVLLRRPQAR